MREIAGELAYGADGPEPSPDLRERILEAARTEPRTATVVPMRRRWLFPATAAAAVAAACAAVGLGLWANSLRDTQPRVVAMDGGGSLVVEGDKATLVACLDDPPAGKAYEAWVIEDDRPGPRASSPAAAATSRSTSRSSPGTPSPSRSRTPRAPTSRRATS